MTYDGFAVYRKYLALKLHFTTDSYDFFNYEGNVHTKLETFVKRNDRYMFHKLSVKYNEEDIQDFLVANFLHKNKAWSGSLLEQDAHELYLQHRKRKDSFTYWFKEDINRLRMLIVDDDNMPSNGFIVSNGQHPKILKLCIGNKIGYESLLVMDYHMGFMKDWNKNITDKVVWPDLYKKLMKYKPFVGFNETETKLILKEAFLK